MLDGSPSALLGLGGHTWAALAALGQLLLGIGVVGGGFWAFYNYCQSRKHEAAIWLQGVFRDFYLADHFTNIRQVLEYHYAEIAGPLLSRRILDREIPLTHSEEELLRELDTLLNYFEHVLYLEARHRFSKRDRQAGFKYWVDLMKEPERASLRRYAARFGFKRVACALDAHTEEYVAVYGSLRQGLAPLEWPKRDALPEDRGPCRIPGFLYDLDGSPGLRGGDGEVIGRLYALRDLTAFRVLDQREGYNARAPEHSLYLRKAVQLSYPSRIDAWVYVYNGDVAGKPIVASGDWLAASLSRPQRAGA